MCANTYTEVCTLRHPPTRHLHAQVKVYLVDFSDATNVLPWFEAAGADPLMLDRIWGAGYANGAMNVLATIILRS